MDYFSAFAWGSGLKVLAIGVGLDADRQRFDEGGADLAGIDLTERAIAHTLVRFAALGLYSQSAVGGPEHLEFPNEYFDLVDSWACCTNLPISSSQSPKSGVT